MAKTPVLGRVKRRLGDEIGHVAALRFYRHCLGHTVMRLARDPRWQTTIAVTPDRDRAITAWPNMEKVGRMGQGAGDLGRRMQRLFARVPPGPAVIVGSDIPELSPDQVAKAFRFLGGADAVFGRAPDGGYWLVGLKRTPRVLKPFANVRWSGPHALADTLANLKGKRVAFVATLGDVDTKQDWRRERRNAERFIFVRPHAATARA
jgi:rSAM/selenodomain-associated transferase 1